MLYLKTVPNELFESAEREIRALQSLNHPSIPKLYCVHRSSGSTELWMTFFSGGTLGDAYRSGKHFSLKDIEDIALQLCEIIGYMHSEDGGGFLHLDLHPDNLILSEGRIRVVDFGNSQLQGICSVGICGTPLFSAPELFDGRVVDKRTDVFSLGKIILWMLSATEIGEKSLAKWEGLREIAACCIRELPENRIQNAETLKYLLKTLEI